MHNFVLAFFDAFTRMFSKTDYQQTEQQKLERFLGQAENRYHLEQLEREYFSKAGNTWR